MCSALVRCQSCSWPSDLLTRLLSAGRFCSVSAVLFPMQLLASLLSFTVPQPCCVYFDSVLLGVHLVTQAAEAAGRDYVWAVDVTDHADSVAALLSIVDGCVMAAPIRRLTIPAVLEALVAIHRGLHRSDAHHSCSSAGTATDVPVEATAGGAGVMGVGGGASAGASSASAAGLVAAHTGSSSLVSRSNPVASHSLPMYDVLVIVDAMDALGIGAGKVVDAIGGVSASSLEAVRAAGVQYTKCVALKDALAACDRAVTGRSTPLVRESALAKGRCVVVVAGAGE